MEPNRTREIEGALRTIAAGFTSLADAMALPEAEEPTPEPEAKTTGPKTSKTPTVLKGAALKTAFRDWVVQNKGMQFERQDAMNALGIGSGAATGLFKWARDRELIVCIGERPASPRADGKRSGGRPAQVFEYKTAEVKPFKRLKRREDGPQVDAQARGKAVVGTGKREKLSTRGDVMTLVKSLPSDWRTDRAGNNHIRVFNAENRYVTSIPNTPSDNRSLKNAKAALRRAGAAV